MTAARSVSASATRPGERFPGRVRVRVARLPFGALLVLLGALLLLTMTLGVGLGPVGISPGRVWEVIWSHLTGAEVPAPGPALAEDRIVWDLRLPRVLLGACVGAGLALVGAALQALVRNPLADPFLLGVSSGASVGAVAVIVAGSTALGSYSVSIGAFVGALISFAIVFVLAQHHGQISPLRMILAGIAITYGLQSVTQYLVLSSEDPQKVNAALFWLFGSLSGTRWAYVTLPGIVLVGGFLILLSQARPLNAMLAGDDTAASLGVNTARLRTWLLALCAILTGVMVSLSGAIGFVGLVIPHMVRLVAGADHRRLLPLTVLVGATFMVWVDVIARMVLQPTEIPVGIVTAIVGAPLFLVLMRRSAALRRTA
jgi:iron complex transport system permease protein